jgi:hypothetical protein
MVLRARQTASSGGRVLSDEQCVVDAWVGYMPQSSGRMVFR